MDKTRPEVLAKGTARDQRDASVAFGRSPRGFRRLGPPSPASRRIPVAEGAGESLPLTHLDYRGPDPHAMAATPPRWDQQFCQVGRGRFRGLMTGVSSASVQCAIIRWQPGVLMRGTIPLGSIALGIPLGDSGEARMCGVRMRAGTMEVLQSGQHYDFVAPAPLSIGVVTVPQSLLRSRAQLLGHPLASLNTSCRLPIRDEAAAERLRNAAMRLIRMRPSCRLALFPDLDVQLVDAILEAGDVAGSDALAVVRRQKARRALRYLETCVDRPETSLADVCNEVSSSERTLHLAFQEAFGISPRAILKALRLDAARRQLNRGGSRSVTDVAMGCGYLHLGRFAVDYREYFAESPSQTLRRVRGFAASEGGRGAISESKM